MRQLLVPGKKIVYIAYSKHLNGSATLWPDKENVGFADSLVISTINL